MTIYCQLLAKEKDLLGYITYVFKNLEDAPFGKKYVMCTRVRNWEHRNIDIGEIGYLEYSEVIAGEDKWFDRNTNQFIPYNYTNIYFIKFVRKADNNFKNDVIL